MPFDGLFIHYLTKEINDSLEGLKIEKIYQPEDDEILLQFRHNKTLMISIDPGMPYFTLTTGKKKNPPTPPMFCMFLRKHLTGGRIEKVHQHHLERLVIFDIATTDEMGHPLTKKLLIEIMGKHSNIMLIDGSTNKILDSIKRVPPSVSRVRSILPGLIYQPLEENKIDLLESSEDELRRIFTEDRDQTPIFKKIYQRLYGMSPAMSKDMLNKLSVDINMPVIHVDDDQAARIVDALITLKGDLINFKGQPQVVTTADGRFHDFYFTALQMFANDDYMTTPHDTYSSVVEYFYSNRNKKNKMHQRTQSLRKTLETRLKRFESKFAKISEELKQAENAQSFQRKGELILANIYQIEKGMNKVRVLNYYVDPPEEIDIALDIRLEPSENAQKFFKRYQKLRNAKVFLKEQLTQTQHSIDYLRQTIALIELSDNHENVEEIRQELVEQGFVKASFSKKKKKQKKSKNEDVLIYTSSDGYTILVGKNNKQNDWLTLRLASKKDVWFHTKEIPGSHVIVRTEGTTPPDQTLLEAAMIAAFHSKGKSSSQVPVDYTLVKNVSKPSGAKPGMVIYQTNQTIFTTPDESIINALKA